MTIAATHLTADFADGAAFVTASVSPTANRLQELSVTVQDDAGAAEVPTSVTGNGLTWVLVDDTGAYNGGWERSFKYRAMGASPSAGAITITMPDTHQVGHWSLTEYSGIDTGGTDGSAAIVQSATNTGSGVTSLAVTLAAFGSANNATTGNLGLAEGIPAITPGTGFTELSETTNSSHNDVQQTQWRVDNDTSVDWSWSGGLEVGGVAIEIKAAAAGLLTQSLIHSFARDRSNNY